MAGGLLIVATPYVIPLLFQGNPLGIVAAICALVSLITPVVAAVLYFRGKRPEAWRLAALANLGWGGLFLASLAFVIGS